MKLQFSEISLDLFLYGGICEGIHSHHIWISLNENYFEWIWRKEPQLKPNGINKRRVNSKKRIERALEYYSWWISDQFRCEREKM